MLLPLLMNLGMFGPSSRDTHDGGHDAKRKRHDRERDAADESKRRAREQLREDIRLAMFGPQAEEVRAELAPYAQPSEAKPFWETLDVEKIAQRVGQLAALKAELARIEHERMIEEDDEEILLLI